MQHSLCVWMDWGQCCNELSLAGRGSARVIRSRRFTERTAWLHRWQIIARVEKLEECSPAHNSLLKNVHHAPSVPAFHMIQSPEENTYSLHVCHSCLAMYYPWNICYIYGTHFQLRLRPSAASVLMVKAPVQQIYS